MLPLIALAALTMAPSPGLPDYISGAPRNVLAAWLEKHPDFRLLTDDDCACDDDLADIRAKNRDYHPYFAVGDFDGNTMKDFAVVVAARSTGTRHVQIFSATRQGGLSYLSPKVGNGSMLFFGVPRPRPYRLVVGAYESEGAIFVPRGDGRYRMQW